MNRIKQILFLFGVVLFMCLSFHHTQVEAASKPATVTGMTRDTHSSEKIWWKDITGASDNIYYQVQYAKSKKGTYKTADVTTNCTYDFSKQFKGTTRVLYVRVRAYRLETNGKKTYGNFSSILEIVRSPELTVTGLKQSKQTRNSITLTWKRTSGANGYYIQYAHCWDVAGKKVGGLKKINIGNRTSYTLKNLDNSYVYKIKLIPYYKSAGGIYGIGEASDNLIIKLVPDQANKLEKMFSLLEDNSYVDGYQVQIYNLETNKIAYDKTMTEVTPILPSLSENIFYKGKVRGYVTVNGQKVYGQWSYYQYSARMDLIYPTVADGKTTFTWSKVRGASGYYVYYNQDGKTGTAKTYGTSVSYDATAKQFSAYVIPYVRVNDKNQKGVVYY